MVKKHSMKKKLNILITSAGSLGALTQITDLSNTLRAKINFFGTHSDKFKLERSKTLCKKSFLIPSTSNAEKYIKKTLTLVKKNKIDYVIPCSDKETFLISKYRKYFKGKLFLPDHKDVKLCQDKKLFYKFLEEFNLNRPYSIDLKNNKTINNFFRLKKTRKSFVRITAPQSGMAYGAAIINNKKELIKWLEMWKIFKNVTIDKFSISEYLPGKIYDTLFLMRDNKLILSKVIEKKKYYLGQNDFTGAGSTPEIAATTSDKISKIITSVNLKIMNIITQKNKTKANGIYHSTINYDYKNNPCITEINIGRFPNINTFFNNFGKTKFSDEFFKIILSINSNITKNIQFEKKRKYMVRSLDQLPFYFSSKKNFKV